MLFYHLPGTYLDKKGIIKNQQITSSIYIQKYPSFFFTLACALHIMWIEESFDISTLFGKCFSTKLLTLFVYEINIQETSQIVNLSLNIL